MNVRIVHLIPASSPGAFAQAQLASQAPLAQSAIASSSITSSLVISARVLRVSGRTRASAAERTEQLAKERSAAWTALEPASSFEPGSSAGNHGSQHVGLLAAPPAIRFRGAADVAGYRQLRRQLLNESPRIIHLWDPQFLPWPAIVAACWRTTWPVVVTFRHPAPRRPMILQLLRRHHVRFVADSEFVRTACQRHGWSNAPQVIRPGCITNEVPGHRPSANSEALGRTLVAIGPPSPHKRLEDAIWSFDMLAPLEPRLQLLVVGADPQDERLAQARRTVRRGARISFLPSTQLPQALAVAEAAIICGNHDGCSEGALQALAAGVPLVAAAGGAAGELLGPPDSTGQGAAGLMFAAGERAELARTMWRLLEDSALRERMSAAARQRAASEFPAARMASNYADLYRSLLRR